MKSIDLEDLPIHGVYSTCEPKSIIQQVKAILTEDGITYEETANALKVNFNIVCKNWDYDVDDE